jgi:hypothetical protein
MDKPALRALVEALQLVMERPMIAVRRATVTHATDERSQNIDVEVDRSTARWSATDASGRTRSGQGSILPPEAALLLPSNLLIWGRWADAFDPIHAERTEHGYLVISRHRQWPEATVGTMLDRNAQIATSHISGGVTVRLVEGSLR